MKLNDLLVILIIVSILIVLIQISVTYIKISDFEEELTGKASGFVNLTIDTSVSINLSRNSLNWGEGVIDSEEVNATLYTQGDDDGNVTRGNWSGVGVYGFIVENIGNINSTLSLKSNKNSSDFFASDSSSNQQYQFNISNKEDSSCSGGATLGAWADANKTSGGTKYCNHFDYNDARNEIYIDALFTVPFDALNIGEQTDTITVTANTAV